MTPWVDIGRLTQPKGVKGRLGAQMAPGLSVSLEGVEVFCVPPALEGPRSHRIARTGGADGDRWVEFDDVLTRDDATTLAGRHCLARREDVGAFDETGPALMARERLEGWSVVDDGSGAEAVVIDVLERPLQPLIMAKRSDGSELMLPLAEELIISIDEAARRIVLEFPQGIERL